MALKHHEYSSPHFLGGVHPPESKELTAHLPVRRMPFPDEVVIPLSQHIGAPAKPIVKVGDHVERGDLIAEAGGFVSVPMHASATGTVKEITRWPHPSGNLTPAIRIAVDKHSAQVPRARTIPDWRGLSKPKLIQAVQDGGVVGLGGAAFPTHVKLSPPEGTVLEYLILNGCECEPYLTTDHRIMVEQPRRVLTGLLIMMRALDVKVGLIGVENNKPDAIVALQEVLPEYEAELKEHGMRIDVIGLTVRYPQGAEKMLILALTEREVPRGKLPLDLGVLVQNVGSVASIAEIFETGLPLLERVVTVTGHGIRKPSNVLVPIGAKLKDVFEFCGGVTMDARQIVMGGPMMGPSQANLETPIIKGITGIVVLPAGEVKSQEEYDCIRCGHCLDACPVFINPQRLGLLAKNMRYETMQEDYALNDCMLCGCCSYVCPSNIPLSQLFGASKAYLRRNG
jgi:Na+-translocating ferredoxin:NAD+ oxidoreductase subunit C